MDIINRVLTSYYNYKTPIEQLAKTFMVSVRTIYNWRQQYPAELYIGVNRKDFKTISPYKKQRLKKTSLLTDDVKEGILKYVDKHFNVTGKRLIKHLKRKFKIEITLSTTYKWLKQLGITYKKVNIKKTFVHKKKEKQIKILKERINAVEDKNNIISIDESHFHINMQQTHSWSKSGDKIYKGTYNKRKDGISLIMAINKQQVIGYKVINGSVDRNIFKEFIESIYKKEYVYLMDNARIHHAKVLKAFIEDKKSQIIYNVAYNPETNPIERVFSTLKSNVVNYTTQNIHKLTKAIEKAISKVNSDHLNNYFNKSLNI